MLSEAVHHLFVLVVILFIRMMVMRGILSLMVVVVIVHRVSCLDLSTSRLSRNLSVVRSLMLRTKCNLGGILLLVG